MNTAIGFTKMSNLILNDRTLSEDASGLMVKILSLNEGWNYTIKGLAALCADGVACVRRSLNELEERKYLLRKQHTDSKGRFSHNEYLVAEHIFDEGFTIIDNRVVRDKSLTLRALGIFAKMSSLPQIWKYTTEGLCKLCKCGITAIRSALKSLEAAGHIIRKRLRDAKGRLCGASYSLVHMANFERPDKKVSTCTVPDAENLTTGKPTTEKPTAEKRTLYKNTRIKNTGIKISSILFRKKERIGREIVLEQLDYSYLRKKHIAQAEQMQELVELVIETRCAKRKTTRIAGADFPHEMVQQRFSQLTASHIDFVMENLSKSTADVRNIKQYLLTCLFNSVATINNSVSVQVNHDMQGW